MSLYLFLAGGRGERKVPYLKNIFLKKTWKILNMNEELDLKEINVVSVIMTLSYARKFYFLETYTEALGVK